MKGRSRRRWLLALALAGAVVAVAAVIQFAFPSVGGPSSLLTVLAGFADIAKRNAPFLPAADGAILAFDDRVRTGGSSHALITFYDGSSVELEPATELRVDEVTPTSEGAITIRMTQTAGRSWSAVGKLLHPSSRYEIQTPAATILVRGTGFEVRIARDGRTSVAATDGEVRVRAQDQEVTVGAGAQTGIVPGQPPDPPTPSPPAVAFRFAVSGPARPVLVDPRQRGCGDHETAGVVRQIPACVVSPSTGAVEVTGPSESGVYTLFLRARDAGVVEVSLVVVSAAAQRSTFSWSVPVTSGELVAIPFRAAIGDQEAKIEPGDIQRAATVPGKFVAPPACTVARSGVPAEKNPNCVGVKASTAPPFDLLGVFRRGGCPTPDPAGPPAVYTCAPGGTVIPAPTPAPPGQAPAPGPGAGPTAVPTPPAPTGQPP